VESGRAFSSAQTAGTPSVNISLVLTMATEDNPQTSNVPTDRVKFTLNFKKQNHDVEFGFNQTLSELRQHIALVTGVAPGLQKLMFKGMLKEDEKSLKELNFKNGCKLMLIGSTINDVMATAAPPVEKKEKEEEEAQKESLSEKMPHKKLLRRVLQKMLHLENKENTSHYQTHQLRESIIILGSKYG